MTQNIKIGLKMTRSSHRDHTDDHHHHSSATSMIMMIIISSFYSVSPCIIQYLMSSNNEKKPTVLIVGASFGGLGCARRLMETGAATNKVSRHSCGKERRTFTIGGLWQFVWTHRLQLSDVEFPLSNANLAGIDVRLGNIIKKWNVVEKHIDMDDESILPYDYIVMACGIVPDPTPIPGIERHVNICSFDTVARQQEEAQDLIHRAKTSPQTFVLAIGDVPYKCPPAPFELTFMLDEMLTKAQVREQCKNDNYMSH